MVRYNVHSMSSQGCFYTLVVQGGGSGHLCWAIPSHSSLSLGSNCVEPLVTAWYKLILLFVYVSNLTNFFFFFICPPFFSASENQARDAKEIMANGYEAVDIQPFDLFPQTRHIENIITFQDTRIP